MTNGFWGRPVMAKAKKPSFYISADYNLQSRSRALAGKLGQVLASYCIKFN